MSTPAAQAAAVPCTQPARTPVQTQTSAPTPSFWSKARTMLGLSVLTSRKTPAVVATPHKPPAMSPDINGASASAPTPAQQILRRDSASSWVNVRHEGASTTRSSYTCARCPCSWTLAGGLFYREPHASADSLAGFEFDGQSGTYVAMTTKR